MAISTGLSTLRRTLSQRLNFWGGDLSNNGPGMLSAVGTTTTAIDINRPEPDDEWDSSWIVLNPGSADQVNAPTIWKRIAASAGWIQSTGTLTIQGTWPVPYDVTGPGYSTGTSTSANASTLTDITQSWIVNQWKGHVLAINNSTAVILSNTATVLTLTSTGWTGGTPSSGNYTVTMPYELYKVFRPENWLQALNWAIVRAYPKRHLQVNFEIPLDYFSRIIRWGVVVSNLAVNNPTVAPVITEIANNNGQYQPGVYTFAYTFYNDLGETLISPTTNLTIVGTNSQIQFTSITGIPTQVFGVNYYSSQDVNNSTLGSLSIGSGSLLSNAPQGSMAGIMSNGVAPAVIFSIPFFGPGTFIPIYNTTNVDVQELHHILKRENPGGYPEIFDDLGSDLYRPLGGKSILLMFLPINNQNLRFICTASLPTMKLETDVTDE